MADRDLKSRPGVNQDLKNRDLNRKSELARGDTQRDLKVPVVEEELQVGKRVVETGGVRISTEVEQVPVEESINLRQEHVRIERIPANRPATEADLSRLKGGVVEVRESAEIPVVNKAGRVVEEISVKKDVEQHAERIRDTVRHTDVEVTPMGEGRKQSFTGDRTGAMGGTATAGYTGARADTGLGTIPNDLQKLEDISGYQIAQGEPDPRGWDIYGMSGDKIGTIKSLLASPSTERVYFAIVDTGGWFKDKLFIVPMGDLRIDRDQRKVLTQFTQEQFKSAPEYRSDERDFNRHYTFWRGLGGRGATY